jgi:hypothetical protein
MLILLYILFDVMLLILRLRNIRFYVLDWVLPRREALYLLDVGNLEPSQDFSAKEIALMRSVLDPTVRSSLEFWAWCHAIMLLAQWGHKASGRLHGCPCHTHEEYLDMKVKDPCPLRGRNLLLLCSGLIREPCAELTVCDAGTPLAMSAVLSALQAHEGGDVVVSSLMNGVQTAKARMSQRLQQVTSYFDMLPYKTFGILWPFLKTWEPDATALS